VKNIGYILEVIAERERERERAIAIRYSSALTWSFTWKEKPI
jgi:hypothetical protein